MAKTFLVERSGANPGGPFKFSELEGQYLRGEIEETTKVCAVGCSKWEPYRAARFDVLNARKSGLSIAGTILLFIGVALCFNCISMMMSKTQEYRLNLLNAIREAKVTELVAVALRHRGSLDERESLDEITARYETKAAKVEAEISSYDTRKIAYGIGGLLFVGSGVRLFSKRFRSEVTSRPPNPARISAPPTSALIAPASKPVEAPKVVVKPKPKPAASEELKGICEHCETHIVFPRELEGQRVSCPSCGQVTVLSDASDVL